MATVTEAVPFTVAVDSAELTTPGWVTDLDSFREWLDEPDVPEKLKTWYFQGEVWVDMSNEQIDSHVDVKTEITSVLRVLAKAKKLGRVLADGVLLTNRQADLSGNPDMLFISNESQASGRVRRIPGKRGGHTELEGTPDMVLEVVSNSSARKDYETLRAAYWEAGIPEYWLVDARRESLHFEILKRGSKGYTAVRKQGGWLKSAAFGRSFRLHREADAQGNPEFTLEVK
jgi:Uma2 family endonuclease